MKQLSPYQTDEYNAAVCKKVPFAKAKARLIKSLIAKKKKLWKKCQINGRDHLVLCFQIADAHKMQPPSQL